jgi:DNA segregation ATPase FtsK/SpoIIIE, S-DNA-T family
MTLPPNQGAGKKPEAQRISEASETGWFDTVISFITRFNRFGLDILGVILLVLALLLLLALLGLTRGAMITPIIAFLNKWLGIGSGMLVLMAGLVGLAALRWHYSRPKSSWLGRILALEGAAFALLAVLSIISNGTLDQAEAGQNYGGIIGWSLAQFINILAGPVWSIVIAVGCLVVLSIVGFGVPGLIERWITQKLAQAGQSAALKTMEIQPPLPVPARQNVPTVNRVSSEKTKHNLPDPYKKTFKAPKLDNEKPIALPERDERLPPLTLLVGDQLVRPDERHINLTAGLIEKTLAEFGIPARVVGFRVGPTVTQFAVEPGFVEKPGQDISLPKQKVRVAQISGLARDLALALSAERLRIEAPVPGRSYVGIEVPNLRSTVVRLRSVLESEAFNKISSPLAIALGRDVSGQPVVADLARMPHVLIAGTTGSGKSVCIAALTTCLIMNNTPEDLKLVMIDPKMVELVRFNGIPHILGKVETDLERILAVLRWVIGEMENRYRLLEQMRARDIETYNHKMERRKQPGLPRIVVMIDELADLMMSAPDQTEHNLVRLAQMARATGIHLVVATQRPSTDVVTGLIKANFPARISFTVASSIDSRVILDTNGAETLLGRGDMLFLAPEVGTPQRAQGVLITDQELERIMTFWQKMVPQAADSPAPWEALMNEDEDSDDELVKRAINIVRSERHASASLLQRRLHIGYPRAARLVDQLEDRGVVGPSQGGGREREVLIDREEDDAGDDAEQDDNETA